ncbi:29188_t:CDS:2 [Gigaspora margarita]|uniref:29188_t:CDS:1 n=1 Tax=Gigaspora margarita TaxID=4874 RepID=A0ABN7VU01_GIGMA|nr:29188_t:CDS:2 [Gigaspora margarita]
MLGPIWATWNQNKYGLLELREKYVFLQCNDKSNVNPIHSQSFVDNVVTILLDVKVKENFKQEFVLLMNFFQNAEKYLVKRICDLGKQEFITNHTDGSCGGFVDPSDWDPGDATYFYMQEKLRDGYKCIQP